MFVKDPYEKDATQSDASFEYAQNAVGILLMFQDLHELRGKTLGCWCHPEPCHGDVLCRLVRELDKNETI